jgi:hypothetical protein
MTVGEPFLFGFEWAERRWASVNGFGNLKERVVSAIDSLFFAASQRQNQKQR